MINRPTTSDLDRPAVGPGRWIGYAWPLVVLVTFVLTAVVAYRPGSDRVLWTVLPMVVVVALLLSFPDTPPALPVTVHRVAAAVAVAGWSVLLFDDDNWSILSVVVYATSFAAGRRFGILLAAATTTSWIVAWQLDDAPWWTVMIPIGVFVVGTMISVGVYRIEAINESQGELIEQLRTTRAELAESERAQGVAEERTRLAGEIHDTLAQGFTSIVLLSRAARQRDDSVELLTAIEQTAQHSLDATRDLIEATQPDELKEASLADALRRELSHSASDGVTTTLRIVGQPRRLGADTEMTVLRATQEALRNIDTHAHASTVEIVVTYDERQIHLEIHDDGVGADPDTITDRGSLTGGQGLKLLEQRAGALSGQLHLDPRPGGGTTLSLRLPSNTP